MNTLVRWSIAALYMCSGVNAAIAIYQFLEGREFWPSITAAILFLCVAVANHVGLRRDGDRDSQSGVS